MRPRFGAVLSPTLDPARVKDDAGSSLSFPRLLHSNANHPGESGERPISPGPLHEDDRRWIDLPRAPVRFADYGPAHVQALEHTYSFGDAYTNGAERFLSRMRWAQFGDHDHIPDNYLLRYAQQASRHCRQPARRQWRAGSAHWSACQEPRIVRGLLRLLAAASDGLGGRVASLVTALSIRIYTLAKPLDNAFR